jgi:hypothetical protein
VSDKIESKRQMKIDVADQEKEKKEETEKERMRI